MSARDNAKAAKWRAANRPAWNAYKRQWARDRRKAERERLGLPPTKTDLLPQGHPNERRSR